MNKHTRHRGITIVVALIVLGMLGYGGLTLYRRHQMRKIPELSFAEALAYTTYRNPEAVITVGVIRDGKASYTVYGDNAEILPPIDHVYEIGSLTKTFTAAFIQKAVDEGRMDLDDTIDRYLPLPDRGNYPTIEALLTHTSGYKSHYFERPMIANFFHGRNSFHGISKAMVLEKAGALHMDQTTHPFVYSNFGYAVLGLVLEAVYETDYRTLMRTFLHEALKLRDTDLSDGQGDLGHYWDWQADDAYIAAGGITSTMRDMLLYAKAQLEEDGPLAEGHAALREIHATRDDHASMGIRMDAIGMAWVIDRENNLVWHNGGTGHFNSYMGIDPSSGIAVVVLSNLSPRDRIPATILGIKRMQELRRVIR